MTTANTFSCSNNFESMCHFWSFWLHFKNTRLLKSLFRFKKRITVNKLFTHTCSRCNMLIFKSFKQLLFFRTYMKKNCTFFSYTILRFLHSDITNWSILVFKQKICKNFSPYIFIRTVNPPGVRPINGAFTIYPISGCMNSNITNCDIVFLKRDLITCSPWYFYYKYWIPPWAWVSWFEQFVDFLFNSICNCISWWNW